MDKTLFIYGSDNIHTSQFDDATGAIQDGDLEIETFPDPYYTKNIEEIKNDFSEIREEGSSYLLVDSNGKMITDQSQCLESVKEYLNKVYSNYDGMDMDYMSQKVTADSSQENPDRDLVDLDDESLLTSGYSKDRAQYVCSKISNETTSEPKCYKYTHTESSKPPYNTTVWTKSVMDCNFEVVEKWDYDDCKNAKLNNTSKQCSSKHPEICYTITNSGYNGVADFYVLESQTADDVTCNNYRSFHFVYRVITILAPIITIFYVTFDFFPIT